MSRALARERRPDPGAKPAPAVNQWWRFMREEGHITAMLPGGADNQGIAVFAEQTIPPAHVTTMLRFDAWTYLPNGPTVAALPPPCTCVTLDGGAVLSDGCPAHDASTAKPIAIAGKELRP